MHTSTPSPPAPTHGVGPTLWVGPPLGTYRSRPLTAIGLASYLLLGMGAIGGALAYGWWVERYSYAHYGPVAASAWSRPWYGLGLAALLAFAGLLAIRLVAARRFIAVHRNGLHLRFFRARFLPWEALEGISVQTSRARFLGLRLRPHNQAVLYPTTGRPIRLPGRMPALLDLLTQIKAHLYQRLSPELEARLASGAWVYFGPLAISTHALRLRNGRGEQDFNWEQIQRLEVAEGKLLIQAYPHQARLAVGEIPNFELMLDLVQRRISP